MSRKSFLLVLALCSLVHAFNVVLSRTISDDLAPLLSPEAVIVDSKNGNLTEATRRWQKFASPTFHTVVQVATEDDIVQTIKYANMHSIPFLVVNAGHGEIKSLERLQNGIQITIRALKSITIKGNTATIQGGASNLDITTTLWNAKKQTVSGTCECVGFLGPLLGGGHGFLQGYYGLVADQLIESRVILANGSIVTASLQTNSDLFWALRGAGHNFGVVTEASIKIYDNPNNDTWYYENYLYTGDSVEQLFIELQNIRLDTPPQFQHYAVFMRNPKIDPVNIKAIIFFSILYNGPAADAEKWAIPFRQFKPLSITNGTTTYPELSTLTGNGINDAICQHENLNRIRYPIYLDRFNPKAPKTVFDIFNQTTAQHPALYNSLMLFEGLSSQAVDAVKLETTAIPVRRYSILASPVVTYAPNPSLDNIAQEFGRNIRRTLQDASGSNELHAYVNYAVGDEALESIYGYRSWRIDKLKKLKANFDVQNRFQWYAPIINQRVIESGV